MKKPNVLGQSQKLQRLAADANKYYHKSTKAWRVALDNARQCGEALIEARKIVPRGWKKWVQDNFDGSYETANVYCRIAKKWNDPRIVTARKKGLQIQSIRGFLDILQAHYEDTTERSSEDNPVSKMSKDEIERLYYRGQAIKRFAEATKYLCVEEMRELHGQFDHYWQDVLYAKVYEGACKQLGEDLNQYLLWIGALDRAKLDRGKFINRKDYVREGAKLAKEDLQVPGKRSRLEHIKEQLENKIRARERILKKANPNYKAGRKKVVIKHGVADIVDTVTLFGSNETE